MPMRINPIPGGPCVAVGLWLLFLTIASLIVGLTLLAGCATTDTSPASGDPFATAQSHFASFGTNRVHYLTVGKGRHTVVFVHCWAGRAEFWREQVPALADKARLILIDLPGHGQSDKPHADYTMDFLARGVLAVLRDAKVKQATLIGHSMGVPVICWVYRDAPEKVAALVAVDGLLRRPPLEPEQSEQFIGQFRAPDYRQRTTQFIRSMFPVAGTDALRERVLAGLLETPQYVMLSAMEGMFGANQPAWDLQFVRVPVLVLNAKNSRWTPEYESYVRSLSEQVDYRTLDGVGHWLMLEQPDAFNAALVEMLQEYQLVGK